MQLKDLAAASLPLLGGHRACGAGRLALDAPEGIRRVGILLSLPVKKPSVTPGSPPKHSATAGWGRSVATPKSPTSVGARRMRRCSGGGSERIRVEPCHVREHVGAAPHRLLNPPSMPRPGVPGACGSNDRQAWRWYWRADREWTGSNLRAFALHWDRWPRMPRSAFRPAAHHTRRRRRPAQEARMQADSAGLGAVGGQCVGYTLQSDPACSTCCSARRCGNSRSSGRNCRCPTPPPACSSPTCFGGVGL